MRISDWSSDVCSSDLLHDYREVVPASDAGLALALSGDSESAIYILAGAARQKGADARTRQNLALAFALSGRWAQARIVASQDLPLDKLEDRSEEHTSELQSLMRISYAVFCLKKKNTKKENLRQEKTRMRDMKQQ